MPEGDDDTSVITSSEGEGRKAPRVQEISVRPLNFAVNLRLPLKRTLFYIYIYMVKGKRKLIKELSTIANERSRTFGGFIELGAQKSEFRLYQHHKYSGF